MAFPERFLNLPAFAFPRLRALTCFRVLETGQGLRAPLDRSCNAPATPGLAWKMHASSTNRISKNSHIPGADLICAVMRAAIDNRARWADPALRPPVCTVR